MADGNWTEWTPKKRDRFLKELSAMPNVSRACRLAQIARSTAYALRERDANFADAWDAAIEAGIDTLEEKAWRRAERESDTLAIFLLKAHRPEKYRETVRSELTGADGGPIRTESKLDLSGMTDEQLRAFAASLKD